MSEIQQFYDGENIFITGGTGFVGKILVEKLLRSCSGIEKIYILVRTKKGVKPDERIQKFLDSPIFGLLKTSNPDYKKKVIGINGDATKIGLGMSAADRALLTKKVKMVELFNNLHAALTSNACFRKQSCLRKDQSGLKVSIIFHAAATVRFDETLAIAVAINVNSVKEIINLSRECDRFKVGVYVSTAFSFCPLDTIKEQLYPSPLTYDESNAIVRIIEKQNWSEKEIAKFTKSVIGKWPNTYTFTKAIAEGIIADEARDLPFCIYRPSIALASYKEPLPGYTDNLLGVNGVVMGMGLGVFHVMCLDAGAVADIIPVDMACNAIIASAWETCIKKTSDDGIPIYNYVSGPENPITWNQFRQTMHDYGETKATNYAVYYYTSTFVRSYPIFLLFDFFVHYIPAVLIDFILILMGRKPMIRKLYKKGHKVMAALLFFTCGSWTFENFRTQSLWKNLSEKDKEIFSFDMGSCNWTDILWTHLDGMRTNILKEEITPESTKRALRRRKVLYVIHQIVKISFVYFVLWTLWKIFHFIWN